MNDFKTLPFATAYLFNETDSQLYTMNKLVLSVIYKYAPLVETKFLRPPAPWMKDIKSNQSECKRDNWRHEAHKNPTDLSWGAYAKSRNKIKKEIKEKKLNSAENFYLQKNANLESNSLYSEHKYEYTTS